MHSSNNSLSEIDSKHPFLYKQRWFILFTLSWLNFTNGILWISYASVSDQILTLYGVQIDLINYLSLVFPVITIILGLPVIWGIDHFGLRATCILCGWLNLLSAVLRLVGSDFYVQIEYRYKIAMAGQIVGSIAQPLAMFSPAKLASLWFPSNQRALATTIGAMGNPLGILLGSLLPPFLIKFTMFNISIGILIIAFISALLPTLAIYHSSPPIPPAISADRPLEGVSFSEQLRRCMRNISFLILSITFGMGLGLFTALSTLFEQIFCPFGYPDTFAGICGGLLIGFGLVGSFFSGLVADRTKAFSEIVQFCFVCTTFAIIAFSILTQYSSIQIPIAISVCAIGAFGVALYSVALELAAEITYPVSENVSTGLLVVSGQIFSVIFILLSQVLWTTLKANNLNQPCSCKTSSDCRNYWSFNVFMSVAGVVGSTIMLLGFSAQYRRRSMERALVTTEDNYRSDVEQSLPR